MSCPDNLLIGSRKGHLSSQEQAQLDAHLKLCPTCRLTLQVGADFDDALQTMAGDDLIAARFARKLGPKLIESTIRPQPSVLRYAWVAAAVLAFLSGAGLAAASLGAWPFASKPAPVHVTPAAPALKTPRKVVVKTDPVREAPAATAEPAAAPQEPVAEARKARTPSAAELFAEANSKRREGEPSRARNLYRELQARYPHSPEVEVSRVSLGRVLLELGEQRAALGQFESYLKQQPRGPLAEEALFGKASALERLQRSADERRTWEALLTAFPSSLYADRARHRLDNLMREQPDADHKP